MRYTTSTIAGFHVVFDQERMEDVFVTQKAGREEDVAKELNAGVPMEAVLAKYSLSEQT